MAVGLYSGVSGLAVGVGLYKGVSGLWGGSSGLINGFGGSGPFPGASLYLDFLTPPLDSRITFSRGTNATLVDSTGRITYAPNNLLLWSEDFTNAIWTKNQGGVGVAPVVTADAGTAPDGTNTADRVQFSLGGGTATADVSDIRQAPTTIAARYIFSFWVRSFDGTSTYNMLARDPNGITNQVVVTGTWTRYSVATTYSAGTSTLGLGIRGGQTPVNNPTADILIWGAQLEPVTYQTTPGTYVATTASAYYGPRFDYDPVTLAPRGLLIEEARTNLLNYSAQFDDAYWAKGGSTVSANVTTAPDGTSTADKLVEDTSTGVHRIFNNIGTTVVSGAPYAWTIYAKAAERTVVQLLNNNLQGATFDLTNGAVSNITGGFTASATNAGNGWYRLFISANASSASERLLIYLQSGGTNTYTGNGTSGIYIYGAQLEAGAFATSYIPTVASTVSRSADVATMTGTNFSSWYNQSEGTFVAEASKYANVDGYAFTADAGLAANLVGGGVLASGAGFSSINAGGVAQAFQSVGSIAPNSVFKIAVAAATNNANVAANGAVSTTDTTVTMPTVDRLQIGSYVGVSTRLNGHIRAIAYYNTRLPNTQLQTLTAPSLASPLALDFISPTYTVGY
jgi:hypothetical protein